MRRSKFPGKPSKHVNRKRVLLSSPEDETVTSSVPEESVQNEIDDREGTEFCDNAELSKQASQETKIAHDKTSQTNEHNANISIPKETSQGSIKYVSPSKLEQCQVVLTKTPLKRRMRLRPLESSLTGKFVLPSRSVHSSRIIKPNKRFLNEDMKINSASVVAHHKLVKYEKAVRMFQSTSKNEANCNPRVKCLKKINKKSNKENCDSVNNNNNSMNSNKLSDNDSAVKSSGKLILRKPRLQIHSQSSFSSVTSGPFSSYTSNSGTNSPGTVTCGVCGAVRFYRFVHQARKFKIYSCESCRKFISKMIKRQSSENTRHIPLVCNKGQGTCHVPPIVRSQHLKLIRCAYKARCPACWLKLCLKSFQLPSQLKVSLSKMLPDYMRFYIDPVIQNKVFGQSWPFYSLSVNTAVSDKTAGCSEAGLSPVDKGSSDTITSATVNAVVPSVVQRLKRRKRVITEQINPPIRRQKIEVKGPRVKHVCRSASLVLGQPLAVFPPVSVAKEPIEEEKRSIVEEKCLLEESKTVAVDSKTVAVESKPLVVESKTPTVEKVDRTEVVEAINDSTNSEVAQSPRDITPSVAKTVDECKTGLQAACDLPDENVPSPSLDSVSSSGIDAFKPEVDTIEDLTKLENTVAADFWESVSSHESEFGGYSLVGADKFSIRALCYLCGSAGLDQLVHCCVCCEPYHLYCVGEDEETGSSLTSGKRPVSWRLTWTCPRCVTCAGCSRAAPHGRFRCSTCSRLFHADCFNEKSTALMKYMVCQSCLKCSDCGSSAVSKSVGELHYCDLCFRMQTKANHCTLCHKAFAEDVDNPKMVKCKECKRWTHAKCEDLSDDKYCTLVNFASYAEFVCKRCNISQCILPWQKIVQIELESKLIQVLKQFCRSRVARSILKNVRKKNQCFNCRRNRYNRAVNDCEPDKRILARRAVRATVSSDSDDSARGGGGSQKNRKTCECDLKRYELAFSKTEILPISYLTDAKNKISTERFGSLGEFCTEMERILRGIDETLVDILHECIHYIFPWFVSKKLLVKYSSPCLNDNTPERTDVVDLDVKVESDHAAGGRVATPTDGPKIDSFVYGDELGAVDSRACMLCKGIGDGVSSLEGRLLYAGHSLWVHANCALWSHDVYEEIDGVLQNIHYVAAKASSVTCSVCKQLGASVQCSAKDCLQNYHYICARALNCFFMHDKTVYCSGHGDLIPNKAIVSGKEFDVKRPLYIEIDRGKNRHVEPEKLQVMLGSLLIEDLGVYNPDVSDLEESLVPVCFSCQKLFWSCFEPWKIVKYTLTTYTPDLEEEKEENFTIDHSLESQDAPDKAPERVQFEEHAVAQVLENMLDIVCSNYIREYDETDYEPQHAADLLPPELKEAIFEDLPHDLLDGISMQDIFPKLMSYEDKANDIGELVSAGKCDDFFSLENSDILPHSVMVNNPVKSYAKCLEADATGVEARSDGGQETRQRSKSDVLPHLKKLTADSRGQQRSCSLTWSCKLDKAMKKRKLDNLVAAKKHQEWRLANEIIVDTFKYSLNGDDVDKETNSNASWNNRARILQVDGADDVSEEDDDKPDTVAEEPVKCNRCQCTYRTQFSFKKHLSTCDEMSTSDESDSEQQQQVEVELELDAKKKTMVAITQPQVGVSGAGALQSQPILVANAGTKPTPQVYTITNLPSAPAPICRGGQVVTQMQPIHVIKPNSNIVRAPQVYRPAGVQQHQQQPVYAAANVVPAKNVIPVVYATSNANTVRPSIKTTTLASKPVTNAYARTGQYIARPKAQQVYPANISFQQIANSNPHIPTLIVQQVASPNIMNAYMEAFQQQTGQTLQYIATIMPERKESQPPAPAQPHFMQQPPGVILQNGGLSLAAAPHIQLAPGPQPIIIQQPRPTIQYTPQDHHQVLIGQAPATLNDGSQVYLTTCGPQMYYGVETIVQNTIMSSQQFVSASSLPGMNSTYSATTTQVYQASKLQHVPDGYVILNQPSSTTTPQQTVSASSNTNAQTTPLVAASVLPRVEEPSVSVATAEVVTNTVQPPPKPVQSKCNSTSLLASADSQTPKDSQVHSNNTQAPTPSSMDIQDNSVTSNTQIADPVKEEEVVTESRPMEVDDECEVVSTTEIQEEEKLPATYSNEPFRFDIGSETKEPSYLEIKPKLLENSPPHTSNVAQFSFNAPDKVPETPSVPTTKVNPIPYPQVHVSQASRPMSRVLPMQTVPKREPPKLIVPTLPVENPTTNRSIIGKLSETVDRLHESLTNDFDKEAKSKQDARRSIKLESASLKLVFQKQSQDGVYKISNKYISKNSSIPTNNTSDSKVSYSYRMSRPLEKIDLEGNKKFDKNTKENAGAGAIKNDKPTLIYKLYSQDGFKCSSTSISELWKKVFESVQAARVMHNMVPLPENAINAINGFQMVGLKNNGVRYLIEQLPGAAKCINYQPKYHERTAPKETEDVLIVNRSGAIRCEPYLKQKEPYDMFSWLASRHRKLDLLVHEKAIKRPINTSLPIYKRFKQLKETSKQTVGVYRSNIHGRGLFCLQDIDLGEMVIEYAGEVIRSTLTDKREKYYNSKGIGCYMFRVDDNFVIDATMKGNAARFINHSCEPNCYSKVLEIHGHKHILIFALRKILKGEELTYDYKFPFEDDKIPCTCGSRRCRKYLN